MRGPGGARASRCGSGRPPIPSDHSRPAIIAKAAPRVTIARAGSAVAPCVRLARSQAVPTSGGEQTVMQVSPARSLVASGARGVVRPRVVQATLDAGGELGEEPVDGVRRAPGAQLRPGW